MKVAKGHFLMMTYFTSDRTRFTQRVIILASILKYNIMTFPKQKQNPKICHTWPMSRSFKVTKVIKGQLCTKIKCTLVLVSYMLSVHILYWSWQFSPELPSCVSTLECSSTLSNTNPFHTWHTWLYNHQQHVLNIHYIQQQWLLLDLNLHSHLLWLPFPHD